MNVRDLARKWIALELFLGILALYLGCFAIVAEAGILLPAQPAIGAFGFVAGSAAMFAFRDAVRFPFEAAGKV